ncbi:MAG: hypothetical protein ACI3XR_02530 [Eubacteriales bacterium]
MDQKTVLISINPKWCLLIASDQKKVEVRKSRPKIETPFKTYIYCTMAKTKDPHELLDIHGSDGKNRKANGKVIGEFVCDEIIKYERGEFADMIYKCGFLTWAELKAYSPKGTVYAWHISNLVIYDKPMELSGLNVKRPPQSWCYVLNPESGKNTEK